MPTLIHITGLLGSVTRPGRLRRALSEALDRAEAGGAAEVELIDLADRRIAFADGRPLAALDDDTEAVVTALARADAVVLATPVYRGSMAGALKNLLDQVPVAALRDKPTAIVAMGGSDHHFLGAERHLRDVLSFFGAHSLPNAAYLNGRDFSAGDPSERAARELDELLAAAIALAGALPELAPLGPAPLGARF
ncbi:MAG TPA: NAD(P)H-dependent oxidoreductase [Solirubrobacteraceae bacterium]|jgi:FMN reductase|nr:NAD(P)H-dependent oxidoreductase [Solirubrobacteraceae bacterium]